MDNLLWIVVFTHLVAAKRWQVQKIVDYSVIGKASYLPFMGLLWCWPTLSDSNDCVSLLVISGFLIQWPILITFVMAPILVWMYLRLAQREEAAMNEQFGDTCRHYSTQINGFIPRIR